MGKLVAPRGSTVGDLLGVAAVYPDGLLIRDDGVYVRYLQSTVVNPLALDPPQAEQVSAGFAQIAARLPDRQSLQIYVEGTPLNVEDMLADEVHRCELAAGAAEDAGERDRAKAIRRLGVAQEQSLRATSRGVGSVEVKYLIVCPWKPTGLPSVGSRRPLRVKGAVHERAVSDSLRHVEGVRADLEAMGLQAKHVGGADVLDLLNRRFDPASAEHGSVSASFLHPCAIGPVSIGDDRAQASERAGRIAEAVGTATISFDDPAQVQVGDAREQAYYVALAPEQTWLGWLLHAMQPPRPFVITVHIEATERQRERMAQRRRYKRLYGVNRGVEDRGRPLDPDARQKEQEAAELTDELATSAGAGIYRVSVYGLIREPGPNPDPATLSELCSETAREVMMACDARIQHGRFAQRALWESTLPLGRDVARRRRRYVTRNVGDTFPLCGTSCGSPQGIPLGYALPGRTLERLDPFDSRHNNHLLLVNGRSGAGKTMATIILLCRALAQGAEGFIIDRAGHFDFLASLIPGAASVEIGADAHAINSWDVDDPTNVGPEKINYLLALHALLLGEHHAGRDSYGLTDLEANLLGLAITEVYERCALTDEEPRELLLQEELERRYEQERKDGSVGIAETLRNLAMRLNNYVGSGPYSYLTDRPTTIVRDAPLVVFDTRSVPDAKAAAILFVLCEHVKSRIAARRRQHLSGNGPKHAWAGRSFLVVDESWKLIERPSTGRWFNEFVRRSRHYALWLIAISQQLSDFANEYGKALLANVTMRLFVHQEARELAYIKDDLQLTDEAIDAISSLKTYRGTFSTAYLMNGLRGEGTIQILVGLLEYWIASNDPDKDEPIRQRALQETDLEGWLALTLLVDPRWQEVVRGELGVAPLTEDMGLLGLAA